MSIGFPGSFIKDMMILVRLWLLVSLSVGAPLNPKVDKEALQDDLVIDEDANVEIVKGEDILSDGFHSHNSQDVERDARWVFTAGDISMSDNEISFSGDQSNFNVASFIFKDMPQDPNLTIQAIDGGWSDWSEYGACSATCGDATQKRTRTCSEPAPAKGGKECSGSNQQIVDCNLPLCACSFNDDQLVEKVDSDGSLSPHDTSALYHWENNLIQYYFNSTTEKDKEVFRSVLAIIEGKTCFKFEEIWKDEYNDKHVLEIFTEDNPRSCTEGCRCSVRKVPYTDTLRLTSQMRFHGREDCESLCGRSILHEFMHVLGVGHTHRRSDRDQFITVNEENLYALGVESEFEKLDHKLYSGVPYDCSSIMHHGSTHYKGKELFKPKDPTTCKLNEQYVVNDGPKASDLDWKLLNFIGKCPVCVTSPGYPNNYPDNSDTKQILSVPDGHHIEITFHHFEVENHMACSYDYLKFLDANSNPAGDKMCGQSVPEKLTIPTSTASAHFYSDGSQNEKGYKFCYKPGRKTALIFLHGLDIGLSSILDCNKMKAELPLHRSVKVVCPEAPEDRNFCLIDKDLLYKFLSVISGTNPKSWYNMCEMPGEEEENLADLHAAFKSMETQIEHLINEGIPSENIVVAGFSQGGSLALYTALHSKHKLGGVIGVATWLPLLTKKPPTEVKTVNADTPVLHVNAEDDLTVTENVGYDTKRELSKVIKDYTFELVYGNNHLDIHENNCLWHKMIDWLWEKELLVLIRDRPSASTCP